MVVRGPRGQDLLSHERPGGACASAPWVQRQRTDGCGYPYPKVCGVRERILGSTNLGG
jgi:hypothetical protein